MIRPVRCLVAWAGSQILCKVAAITLASIRALRTRSPSDNMPSCLHGHSALSRASSRHSGGKGCEWLSDPDSLTRFCPSTRATCRPRFSRRRLQTHGLAWSPRSERPSALHGHAAASTDGHVSHDADRFASTRLRRAAAARDVRSAGTASPVPKYISSGVCP
jgi:hypothetical protein